MVDTISWAWHVTTPWPGFPNGTATNLNANGNGIAVDPLSYTDIVWRDADGDDRIADTDTDDASTTSPDLILIGGVTYSVLEIAAYAGSTMVIKDVTYTPTLAVWLLNDGSYLVRLNDAAIPQGLTYAQVQSLQLGTWDGIEYSHSYVSTRDGPFICFAAGTLIHTITGVVPAETIQPGDLVLTADHGYQPVRWAAQRRVNGHGAAAPVLIRRGALGNLRDLRISQQHRIVLSDWRAQLYFGAPDILVPAVHLVDGRDIIVMPCESVVYVHFLFDRHEVVFSEGIPTESFHPGEQGLSKLDEPAMRELRALFPELAQPTLFAMPSARPSVKGWEARALSKPKMANAVSAR